MSEPHDAPERHRYELDVDGETAFAEYQDHGTVRTFTHTLVPKPLEGRGIASKLIGFALADVRAKGMKLVPQCPFVHAYIEKHSEWRDLLA